MPTPLEQARAAVVRCGACQHPRHQHAGNGGRCSARLESFTWGHLSTAGLPPGARCPCRAFVEPKGSDQP